MRSIGILSFGKADKLEILDVPRPEISLPGDIIVNVKAVALSPAEGVKLPGYSRLIETVKYSVTSPGEFAYHSLTLPDCHLLSATIMQGSLTPWALKSQSMLQATLCTE